MAELATTSPTDADSVKTLLEATFGTSFDVWMWSDGWRHASGSMPRGTAEDSPPLPLRRLLDQLRAGPTEPRVADGDAAGQWLLVPFPAGEEPSTPPAVPQPTRPTYGCNSPANCSTGRSRKASSNG